MKLSDNVFEKMAAGFSGLYIVSSEHEDAIDELRKLCMEQEWLLSVWDSESGLTHLENGVFVEDAQQRPGADGRRPPPLNVTSAVDTLPNMTSSSLVNTRGDQPRALLVLKNGHRFMDGSLFQKALRMITLGKQNCFALVILSPTFKVPPEHEAMKAWTVIEHQLPDRTQLRAVADGVAVGQEGAMPEGSDLDKLLDAAAGMGRQEFENACALSIIRHGRLQADAIWDMKHQMLKTSQALSIYRGNANFSQLGGLEPLKNFVKDLLVPSQPRDPEIPAKPKGVFLVGQPGTGKSQLCKSLGNDVGRPVMILDVGALMGGLVGQTEENTRRVLKVVDAMAPAILMIDEVEKAMSGASSGRNDSGVTSRMFGAFLTWLNDHETDIFVVCTANKITSLPEQFTRSERFDALFFLDLPGKEQREVIWNIYRKMFKKVDDTSVVDDEGWTGAEIRSCCRLAALMHLSLADASKFVVPVSRLSAEAVVELREWAKGRCIDANRGGLYGVEASVSAEANGNGQPRRRLGRGKQIIETSPN